MINKTECYNDALQQVRNHRHFAIEQANALRDKLLTEHCELKEIENRLIALSKEKMAAKVRGDRSFSEIEKEYIKTKEKKQQLLTQLGCKNGEFSPVFNCNRCEDTGLADNQLCECVKKIAHKKMLDWLCKDIPAHEFNFADFDLSYYQEGAERNHMESVFQRCQSYSANFNPQANSLYLLGNTGLGKTHLTLAMAKEIVAKGYQVIYCPTQSMITALEKEHFGHLSHPVGDYYRNCHLLILDDLGTEYLSPVAQSALYDVINQRILLKLPTIINSNLTPQELEKRYGERLVSRIFGNYTVLSFKGRDIRIQKQLASKKI
jgi:DNA replication protein DnaC